MSATCPPSFEEIAFSDGVAAWSAAVDGLAGWYSSALARGATPLELAGDLSRWWALASQRRPPSWASPRCV